MMICPLSGEQCMDSCAWMIDGECAMSKISYSLYVITRNTRDIAEELDDGQH